MQRKAQAAMEFLMTYGWAILVVLVVLGALAYFGVLSPQTLLPSRCETGEMWLKCTDYKLDSANDRFTLTLQNNWQYDIKINSISVDSTVFSCSQDFGIFPTDAVLRGQENQFVVTACSDIPEEIAGKAKVRSDLKLTWERSDVTLTIEHNTTGVLIVQVE